MASKQQQHDDESGSAADRALRANRRQALRRLNQSPAGRRRRAAMKWLNALSVFAFLLAFFGAVFLGTGIYYLPSAGKSAFTQSHGVRYSVTVTNATIQRHCGPRVSCYYTTDVSAAFRSPADGHDTTTVHVPYKASYAKGQSITAFVDPSDPGYSEIRGKRFQDMPAVPMTVISAFALALGAALIFFSARLAKRLPGRTGAATE